MDHSRQIVRAAEILRQGGLVIFPTETFYGIAAAWDQPRALERLAELKGREASKPIALSAADASQIDPLVKDVSGLARGLMARFWPGPLTLVLTARAGLHPCLVSADGGVGVRVSPHPAAAGLSRALGRAVTATSANPAGRGAPRRAADLDPALARGVDLVLDLGPTPGGPASTVLDARRDPPVILRAGAAEVPGAVG